MVTIQKKIDRTYQNVGFLFNLVQNPGSSKKALGIAFGFKD